MNLRVHPLARDDAKKAARYYDRQRRGLGADFYQELAASYLAILDFPRISPLVETSAVSDEIRQYGMKRFPFGIVYVIAGEEIRVLAIAHFSRRPGYWHRRNF